MVINISPEAFKFLNDTKVSMLTNPVIINIIEAKEEVYDRFSFAFQLEALAELPEGILADFLLFKNNKHWSGLHRASGPIFNDFEVTKNVLQLLVDDTKPISSRLEGVSDLKGMGIGIASAILHVAHPDKYGVWNNTSEAALRQFGWMPKFSPGASLGEKYRDFNRVLVDMSRQLEMDLWTLDSLWWHLDDLGGVIEGQGFAASKPKFNGREKSIKNIIYSVNNTVKQANGQIVPRKVKAKELRMTSYELEARVRTLLDERGDCCAVTGLPFQFEDEGADANLRPSLDRIDSDGHYEASNVQLVCRFINFWKQATEEGEFRRLIKLVRETG